MVTESEGRVALAMARTAIERHLGASPPTDPARPFAAVSLPALFDESRGVFVTLTDRATHDLRGCIGYPLPVEALRAAIPHVAVAASVDDPRFPPVRPDELDGLAVEVSILTLPQPIEATTPDERERAVVVGRDGLIVRSGRSSGLLLPQVATGYGWSAATFLGEACRKAGLPPAAWRSMTTQVARFQAEVFSEEGSDVRPH
jgi:uncharacterized protein (TIGR00296 family)